jgi:hypothetical protein
MFKSLCTSLAILGAALAASAQDQVTWIHEWDTGLKEAKASGKPIFVMFTADW